MTILHHLRERAKSHPQKTATLYKDRGQWRSYTWKTFYELVEALGTGLADSGLKKNDRVAIISESCAEWSVIDYAIMGNSAITVPIYSNQTADEIQKILQHSHTQFVFVENSHQYEKLKKILPQVPSLKNIYCIQTTEDLPRWLDLVEAGRKILNSEHFLSKIFIERLSTLQTHDWATLLYTSGTMGEPKGVVITHEQIMSEVVDIFSAVPLGTHDVSLTFLPFSHIMGRVESWGAPYVGYTIGFAESIERLKINFSEVRPTFIIAVPRVFEKLYIAILTQAQNNPIKKKVFDWALQVGHKYSKILQKNEAPPLDLLAQYKIAHKLVFNTIKKTLGGRLKLAVCGGAPSRPEILEFFHSLGLLILEGYGLTETTAAVTFNTPLRYRFGTVGQPLNDVEIRFESDGEILVRSKKCMKEYYLEPEENKKAFDEAGFFRTGDIGHFDEAGYLKITDRKKDLIKTAGGKYVAPQRLESLLKKSPLISQVLIHGDQKKYIVALLTLNPQMAEIWIKSNAPHLENKAKDFAELCRSPEIYSALRDHVAQVNSELASFESIKKFSILDHDFTIEGGELTPSLKVKRKFCDQKYAKEIAALYGEE